MGGLLLYLCRDNVYCDVDEDQQPQFPGRVVHQMVLLIPMDAVDRRPFEAVRVLPWWRSSPGKLAPQSQC